MAKSVLIIDSRVDYANEVQEIGRQSGFLVHFIGSVYEAINLSRETCFDYCITELKLEDGSAFDIIDILALHCPDCEIVIVTAYGDIPTAVAASKLGVIDYIAKPVMASELINLLSCFENNQNPLPHAHLDIEDIRWKHIKRVFENCDYDVQKTSKKLNMHRRSLLRIVCRHIETLEVDEGYKKYLQNLSK